MLRRNLPGQLVDVSRSGGIKRIRQVNRLTTKCSARVCKNYTQMMQGTANETKKN